MQSWEARLNERRVQFLGKTKGKISDVLALLDELVTNPADSGKLAQLNKQFHQLAGAGGIYELNEFCELAIAAENICIQLTVNKAPVRDLEQQKLRSQCAAMLADVEKETKKTTDSPAPALSENFSPNTAEVLIVDQNSERLVAWHRTFEENKMTVRTVRTASGARGAMLTKVPDALIVLAPLPDSEFGLEIVEHMRSIPGGKTNVAVVVVENANFKTKIDGVRSGVDSFLDGPADPKEVLLKTRDLLNRQRPAQYKVLSVEDDPEQAYFIKTTLESVGYSVLHIADAADFEVALNSFAPDLVLLDIVLGDISGHDLARYVRKHEKYGKLPIVFLTTQNQLNMHVESARAGGDDHLIKPVAPQLLVATIGGRLERDA